MHLEDLVQALLSRDALTARAWVADASRAGLRWLEVPRPEGLDPTGLAIAAGISETLAARSGQAAPQWTADVPGIAEPFLLVRAAATMPRLRRLCETEGPEPLRRRGLLAPPEFLTAA